MVLQKVDVSKKYKFHKILCVTRTYTMRSEGNYSVCKQVDTSDENRKVHENSQGTHYDGSNHFVESFGNPYGSHKYVTHSNKEIAGNDIRITIEVFTVSCP